MRANYPKYKPLKRSDYEQLHLLMQAMMARKMFGIQDEEKCDSEEQEEQETVQTEKGEDDEQIH